jgi:hypothetical protein
MKEWPDADRIRMHIEACEFESDQARIDYQNGRIRGLEGAQKSDNPYPYGKPGYNEWELGRRSACGPVAQWLEQPAHNGKVEGSIPSGATKGASNA